MDDLVTLENGDFVCQHHAAECEATGEMHLRENLASTAHDGDVCMDYTVRTYPDDDREWEQKCYKIVTPNGVIYVHEEDMDARMNELFGREGDLLVPRNLLTLPIYTDFVPTNVEEGGECSSITDVIETRGLDVPDEDEGEFEVIPFVGSMNMNMNEEVRV